MKKNKLISAEPVLANLVNKHFTNTTKQMNFRKSPQLNNAADIIYYYHDHICIKKLMSSSHAQSEAFTFNQSLLIKLSMKR